MKRTKVIATMGPACETPEMIEAFIKAGVNVFRLNFSHGEHAKHLEYIKTIRSVAKKMGTYTAILADLQGPKIRVGVVDKDLKKGEEVILACDKPKPGEVPVQYKKLYQDVKVGDPILLDDGKIEITVTAVKGKKILARVKTPGFLTSKKGINLPTSSVTADVITKKDTADALFALAHGVDFLALSFVKSEKDVIRLRKIIAGSKNPEAKIIAKIERHEAIAALDEIIQTADAIMVARGDLGIEVLAQDVPIVQKQIIRKCLTVGKPCIVATQMLESMIQNPRSTRAETSDIANAILDGTDAVMLSGETSVGKYPLNAVRAMKAVALNTEEWMERDNIVIGRRIPRDVTLISEAIAQAAVQISRELSTRYLVAGTASGSNAREIAKFRPHATIIAVTSKEVIARQLSLSWGVLPMLMTYNSNREMSAKMSRYLLKNKLAEKGDKLTIVSGLTKNKIGGTNLIRVHVVE